MTDAPAHTDPAGNATIDLADLTGATGRQTVQATAGDTVVATSDTINLSPSGTAPAQSTQPGRPAAQLAFTGGNPVAPLAATVLVTAGAVALGLRRRTTRRR